MYLVRLVGVGVGVIRVEVAPAGSRRQVGVVPGVARGVEAHLVLGRVLVFRFRVGATLLQVVQH